MFLTPSLKEVVEGYGGVSVGALKCFAALFLLETHLHQVLYLVVHGDFSGIILGPFGSLPVELLKVIFVHLSNDSILRVIYIIEKRARRTRRHIAVSYDTKAICQSTYLAPGHIRAPIVR